MKDSQVSKTNVTSPFFSIIIPTYNRANFVVKAIQSVLNQSITDWEIIIVDDGSTDDTAEKINCFNDQRITYYWKINEERSIARNFGIKKAKGKYLCFLDSDDLFLANHLHILKEEILKQNEAVGAYRSGMIYKREDKHSHLPLYNKVIHHSPIEFAWYNPITLLSIAFHKDICQIFTFPEHYNQFEDFYFLIDVLSNFPLFQASTYTCIYVHHKDMSSVQTNNYESFNDELKWFQNIFTENHPNIKKYLTPSMQKEGVARHFLKGANKAFYNKNFSHGLKYFYKAIRTKISIPILPNYYYTFALFWARLLFNYPKMKDAKKE